MMQKWILQIRDLWWYSSFPFWVFLDLTSCRAWSEATSFYKTLICQYSRYSLSYTTARGHILDFLTNIGLNHKKFGLHSLRSGGALATANLGVNDRLFEKTRWVEVRQSKGQLRSRRYRNKTFSIKEPRSLAITSTRKYTRLNYYKKLCFWFNPV